ncbi:alanyl-tRNA editing protein [Xenorhabdus sp. DI]|uniref:alanyl-tRNA editing protein n=1 Tax=Xenorhabdus doucetiae TaxID=351671 RepID=UPI0019962F2F|nr:MULTISPECIES: alanyl-tRNA editing protein [unclassified Xenorhabdus]MBD2784108.1 alanyl-tRNA editing protein [Xenorhabdus sp. 3]MBD2787767.1 alanyl-tRNA editing protein [Xenorhabdus sp. DI]
MSERLYLSSSSLTGDVEILDCSLCDDGRYAIQLKATPFHPQGGGQPSDTGWLNDVEVTHVTLENNRIIHYTTHPVTTGIALARVDEKRRQLHSQLHSAGHLIGHIVEPLGWHPIRAHHWPGESRVTFKSGSCAQAFSIEDLQKKCDQCIDENLPCQITMRDDGFRQVSFGEFTPYPCGGTHVVSLRQIHGLRIQAIQEKKGQLSVKYDVIFPA